MVKPSMKVYLSLGGGMNVPPETRAVEDESPGLVTPTSRTG